MADCISRGGAAITYIKDNQCRGCSDIGLCGNCAVLIALKLLTDVPAADVRPAVKSRWVEIDDYVLCANCGVAEHSPNRNYCHNCGAVMREIKDD